MRRLYNVLVVLGLPFVAIYWLWRAVFDTTYRRHWSQRFGFGYPQLARDKTLVWVHAVSVGEVQAAASLILALQERLPDADILVTTVTATGADRVRLLFGDKVTTAYVPYDVRWSVRRFYEQVKPTLAIIVETELWPNLYHEAGQRRIPLVLASARISPRSMPRYRRLVGLFRDALSNGIIIAAQSEVDRQRFVELGAPEERTFVCGNIKFDVEPDARVPIAGHRFRKDMHLESRPVWVAASTHAGEEEILLEAHNEVLAAFPEAVLILVPRHPGRFDDVAGVLERTGHTFVRRTDEEPASTDTRIVLGDTMGEVPKFYAASDVAFVGGSLVRVGGHNLLEPAALSKPIITGPHLFNAQDISQKFKDSGSVVVVEDASALATTVIGLLRDAELRDNMGERALQLISENRGAVDRLLTRLEPVIGGGTFSIFLQG